MNFWSVLLLSVVYFYTRTTGLVPQKLPESWKCVDPKCSVPISEAKPVLKQYNSLRNLSLRKDQTVTIYGKGSKTYDVEVDGKRGLIPKNVVMETRLFVRDADLKFIVTSGTKDEPNEKSNSENRVEINLKTIPETKVEPTIDIVDLKPEMPPAMQGAFLLAGAAADDSGMTSSPKIPDAVPDAVKNARSPTEDEKSSLDAPAEVHEPDVADSDMEIEAGPSNVDVGFLDIGDNITDATDSALKEPAESVPKIKAHVDTAVGDTMANISNDTAKLEISNETTYAALDTKDLGNDTVPYVVSGTTDEIKGPNVAEKESVDKIPEEAKIEESIADFSGGLFRIFGSTPDSREDKQEAGKEEEGKTDLEREVGDVKKADSADKRVVDESAEDPRVEEVNLTDKEVFEAVKLPVGIEIDVGAENDIDQSKLEDTAKNLTEEDEKPDKVETTETEKIVESRIEVTQTENIIESRLVETEPEKIVKSFEKVEQPDLVLDLNVSGDNEVDSATEIEPSVHEPVVVGGTYEEKIGDKYGGEPKQEEEKKEEVSRGGRVKRDFMYQQNQYAYNAHPNYQQQQQRNYGGRMNDYNTNNYRQYQTEYPNAYAYQQQHGNYEGNMHHQNMETNMHHQNMYHSTQQPPKVETSTAKTVEPSTAKTEEPSTAKTVEPSTAKTEEPSTAKTAERSIPATSTQEPPTQEPVVTEKQDYEDVSVEVDDNSEEVVTDVYQKLEDKEESATAPTTSEPTSSEATSSSEAVDITEKPEVVEEEKVEEESMEPPHEEIVVTSEEVTESDSGWFGMKAIIDLFSSEKSGDDVADLKSSDGTPESILPPREEEFKVTDEQCSIDDVTCGVNKPEEKLLHGDLPASDPYISERDDLLGDLMEVLQKNSSGPIFCLIVTAFAVVGFSLGYNFIENRKREGELVAKINSLEKENLVEKKEKSQLKDKLQHVSETSTLSSESETSYLSQIAALTEERNTLIAEKRDLEDQLMETERDLQTATESNLEMNNLLSESLSTPDGSTVLLETVDKLKAKLENQNLEMKELNRLLNEKSEEIDSIRKELKANQEAKKLLQEKLTTLKREKDEEMLQLKETNRDLSTQVDDLMESKSLEKLKLSNELSKLQMTLTETQTILGDRNGEIDALKDFISRLRTDLKDEELNNLYDVASVTGKLIQAEAERDCYKEKFLGEEGARKLLEGHVQVISQEVASLKENYEAAEKEKIEALTKVQVLSNYFKEKETQLQKELGLKESMWLQKQSDDNTIYEQMKSLREENERYKSQLDSLQKEIAESETDYKSQIAKAEQKSYENWLTSRQYERKLKESQGEATQLRNMLTMIEKNSTNHSTDDLKQSISEVSNGDPSSPPPRFLPPPPTSPPFMMFQPHLPPPHPHPHHHDFVPPPPLYPPPPEVGGASSSSARPPTLGRISSPPLQHPRFSPPYMFDPPPYHPQHSPSPPPPHRPMPKPPHMSPASDQKESMSPGYSEHHDRPNRRSKR